MDSQLFELLKWIIGVPAAIITFITIPYIFQKHRLEIKKLRVEIEQLKGGTQPQLEKKRFWLVSFFAWLAPFWIPLCCLQSFFLIGLAIWKKNGDLGLGGFASFFVLLAIGAMINYFYGPFDLRRRN